MMPNRNNIHRKCYEALMSAKLKLKFYREASGGEYVGGTEYTALVRQIDDAINACGVKLIEAEEASFSGANKRPRPRTGGAARLRRDEVVKSGQATSSCGLRPSRLCR